MTLKVKNQESEPALTLSLILFKGRDRGWSADPAHDALILLMCWSCWCAVAVDALILLMRWSSWCADVAYMCAVRMLLVRWCFWIRIRISLRTLLKHFGPVLDEGTRLVCWTLILLDFSGYSRSLNRLLSVPCLFCAAGKSLSQAGSTMPPRILTKDQSQFFSVYFPNVFFQRIFFQRTFS